MLRRGWWERDKDFGSMQMVEALGSASVANAIISFFFFFWRVLRPPLRKQARFPHSA